MIHSGNLKSGLYAGLIKVADLFSKRVIDNLNKGNYPHGDAERGLVPIQDTMVISQPVGNESSMSITVSFGGETAPYAVAYEFGSGIHRELGGAGLYPIAAKNKPNLVFWWEKGGKWFVGPALPYGHPGVEKKPYIQPAINDTMLEAKKILGEEFKVAILAGEHRIVIK